MTKKKIICSKLELDAFDRATAAFSGMKNSSRDSPSRPCPACGRCQGGVLHLARPVKKMAARFYHYVGVRHLEPDGPEEISFRPVYILAMGINGCVQPMRCSSGSYMKANSAVPAFRRFKPSSVCRLFSTFLRKSVSACMRVTSMPSSLRHSSAHTLWASPWPTR